MAYRNYATANGFIVAKDGNGDFLTIATALTAAVSGDTIFIRPGTYTENLTLKVGVNLTAFDCDAITPNVIITGKATFTAAGTVSISGIQLTTNSDFLLAVTGSAASIVNLKNCNLNCSNNTGISFTSSSGSAQINCYQCTGNLGTTGIGLYSSSSAGEIQLLYCQFSNSGASTTASSNSAGVLVINFSQLLFPISTSSTGIFNIYHSIINSSPQNATCVTTAGTGTANGISQSQFFSGSASAISIGANTEIDVSFSTISSTNANAITGAGSIAYQGIGFVNSSVTINTTSQITRTGTLIGSLVGTAPTTGFLGESVTSSASAVSLSTGTAKNVTSISLTAGIWDVSGLVQFVPGGATNSTIFSMSISTTSATLAGATGDTDATFTYGSGILSLYLALSVPRVRATLTTTTIYYLVASSTFTVSTQSVNGRISATRVG